MSNPSRTTATPGQGPETACCSPAEQATCCRPAEKAGCCGSDSTRCGC